MLSCNIMRINSATYCISLGTKFKTLLDCYDDSSNEFIICVHHMYLIVTCQKPDKYKLEININ